MAILKVKHEDCQLCMTCVAMCPYKALFVDEEATPPDVSARKPAEEQCGGYTKETWDELMDHINQEIRELVASERGRKDAI